MRFANETLRYVVCPQCQGALAYTREEVLFCIRCRLGYPIHDGVPDLSVDAAMHLADDVKNVKKTIAVFFIETGPQKGINVTLNMGTCMAIGRSIDDLEKTKVTKSDFIFSLDDHNQKLIQNYLTRT